LFGIANADNLASSFALVRDVQRLLIIANL